jgi:hypothetical protein
VEEERNKPDAKKQIEFVVEERNEFLVKKTELACGRNAK